ncbi:hypothetical protein P8452_29796 [Trifolium repens]|nr:hypothetical protein P8452_29796 [Trifolium repens]
MQEQEGATLLVSAKFTLVSARNIYLQFQEITVQDINISEQLQALIAPAILPRSFINLQILQYLRAFKAQIPVSPGRESVGGLYYLSYLDDNMLLGRAVGGGAALYRIYPNSQTWPAGPPIPPGLPKRRFMALHISQQIFGSDPHVLQVDEIVGHSYLFLKEQFQLSIRPPPHSGILHGTMIDELIGSGKSRDVAHELASRIWVAVVDNLEENNHTFCLLKRLAQEGDVFLPYPYTRSDKVQWRVFEKLFTDFRDCFNHEIDYYDMLACAKSRFHPIPSAW